MDTEKESMDTRRFPRTLTEAFGPYTSQRIEEQPDPMPKSDKIALVAGVLACVAVVCFAAVGWI